MLIEFQTGVSSIHYGTFGPGDVCDWPDDKQAESFLDRRIATEVADNYSGAVKNIRARNPERGESGSANPETEAIVLAEAEADRKSKAKAAKKAGKGG